MILHSIEANPKARNKKITKEKGFVLVNANSDHNVVDSGSRLELKSAGRTMHIVSHVSRTCCNHQESKGERYMTTTEE